MNRDAGHRSALRVEHSAADRHVIADQPELSPSREQRSAAIQAGPYPGATAAILAPYQAG